MTQRKKNLLVGMENSLLFVFLKPNTEKLNIIYPEFSLRVSGESIFTVNTVAN